MYVNQGAAAASSALNLAAQTAVNSGRNLNQHISAVRRLISMSAYLFSCLVLSAYLVSAAAQHAADDPWALDYELSASSISARILQQTQQRANRSQDGVRFAGTSVEPVTPLARLGEELPPGLSITSSSVDTMVISLMLRGTHTAKARPMPFTCYCYKDCKTICMDHCHWSMYLKSDHA